MFFAQHFTHQFFTTVYGDPAFTWGRHGVVVSHIYGQGIERENKLRTFKDGKLKSQVRGQVMVGLTRHKVFCWRPCIYIDYS